MFEIKDYEILCGDALEKLKELPDKSVQTCITSPPYYGLRDYGTGKWIGGDPNCPHRRMNKFSESCTTGHAQYELRGNVGDAIYKVVCPLCGAVREDKQIGLEDTPDTYISKLVEVFREVRRVLRDDGTLWVNIGDSYAGSGKGRNADGTPNVGEGNLQEKSKGSIEGYLMRSGDGDAKPKDLIGIPWMLAFALRDDGWYLRQDIIWHKPNPMPESVKDRCTKSHEYIFLLSKEPRYFFDNEAIKEDISCVNDKRAYMGRIEYSGKREEGEDKLAQKSFVSFSSKHHKNLEYDGQTPNTMHIRRLNGEEDEFYPARNKRDVWTVTTSPYKGAHFATFPEKLIEPCVLAGSKEGDIILDPFNGSGTTGAVAMKHNRKYIGVELNKDYVDLTIKRFDDLEGIEEVYNEETKTTEKVKKVDLF